MIWCFGQRGVDCLRAHAFRNDIRSSCWQAHDRALNCAIAATRQCKAMHQQPAPQQPSHRWCRRSTYPKAWTAAMTPVDTTMQLPLSVQARLLLLLASLQVRMAHLMWMVPLEALAVRIRRADAAAHRTSHPGWQTCCEVFVLLSTAPTTAALWTCMCGGWQQLSIFAFHAWELCCVLG